MKLSRFFPSLVLACAIAVVGISTFTAGCQSSAQVAEYKTLKTVGESAKATMDTATQLLKAKQISVVQWQKIAAFYDGRFQPAFALALTAAQSNLSNPAPADLLALANSLSALVISYTSSP